MLYANNDTSAVFYVRLKLYFLRFVIYFDETTTKKPFDLCKVRQIFQYRLKHNIRTQFNFNSKHFKWNIFIFKYVIYKFRPRDVDAFNKYFALAHKTRLFRINSESVETETILQNQKAIFQLKNSHPSFVERHK